MIVYGCSDDLIEFECIDHLKISDDVSIPLRNKAMRDSKWSDEVMIPYGDEEKTFNLKDGTKFTIKYDDEGIWRVEIHKAGDNYIKVVSNEERDDEDSYSDVMIMKGFDSNPIISEGNKMIKTIYANRYKEDNWDITDEAEELGYENTNDLRYLGLEIELEVEIDEHSKNKVLKIQGKDVSDLGITI